MKTGSRQHTLLVLLVIYGLASLLHFSHNAEFISEYPNLPASWSRADVYLAWAVLTAVGVFGWLLVNRGYLLSGLLFLAVYAAGGLDSLGHYLLAPMSAHTLAMNATIMVEVTCAALLFAEVTRLGVRRLFKATVAVTGSTLPSTLRIFEALCRRR
jgi:hypothetical protein